MWTSPAKGYVPRISGEEEPGDRVWLVTDFGAVGDDRTMNTGAIQEAIDACHLSGGGVVRFTPGVYLSGTLILKDRVGLKLDAGAVLKGSPHREDYRIVRGVNAVGEPVFADHVSFLIYAEQASYISITGQGEIHGNGEAFWLEDRYVFREDIMKRALGEWRPRALICFLNCLFIKVRDVQMTHSPCYTLWPLGCDDVTIDAITIRNPLDGPNTDGIDLDCCRRVTVSNCVVEGGDDAICLKSDGTKLGEERPCEQVVVTNCILRSRPACGVRIGYEGDSPIRDCLFSNLVIYGSHHGIDIVSILPDQEYPFTILHGTRVENIQFENLVMRDVMQPIHFWMGNEKPGQDPEVLLRNIRVSNVVVENGGDSFIGSLIDRPVENKAPARGCGILQSPVVYHPKSLWHLFHECGWSAGGRPVGGLHRGGRTLGTCGILRQCEKCHPGPGLGIQPRNRPAGLLYRGRELQPPCTGQFQ